MIKKKKKKKRKNFARKILLVKFIFWRNTMWFLRSCSFLIYSVVSRIFYGLIFPLNKTLTIFSNPLQITTKKPDFHNDFFEFFSQNSLKILSFKIIITKESWDLTFHAFHDFTQSSKANSTLVFIIFDEFALVQKKGSLEW